MEIKKVIGSRINNALSLRDKKQKDLAEELGVTANTISYFCNGNRAPNIEQLIKISSFLDVTTDYLLGKTDDPDIVPTASDELGLSPQAIQWIKNISCQSQWRSDTSQEISDLFENRLFQQMCIGLTEYKHAIQAEKIENQITAYCERHDPKENDPDLFMEMLQLAANSEKYSEHTKWFLRAQYSLYDADDQIFDALWDDVDGFSFSSLWSQKSMSFLLRLIEEIDATVTNDLIKFLNNGLRNVTGKDALDDAIFKMLV